jgi:alpha-amylase/alpha-mannosidase (GH57 family)
MSPESADAGKSVDENPLIDDNIVDATTKTLWLCSKGVFMMRKVLILTVLMVFALAFASCIEEEVQPTAVLQVTEPAATASPTEAVAVTAVATQPPSDEEVGATDEPIYLAIIWHQHQPVYYQDPETGIYNRPWVRVHATKDYVDMAAILESYPDIHATYNLTPSLIRQLDSLAAGDKDLYWVYAEVPAGELTEEQKQFILDRFFDTNRRIIERFPRYQELLELRDTNDNALEAFGEQDYRDLQILFNLAWVDPDWLGEAPLAGLVGKGRDFSEADKGILFAEHLRLINEVIPVHRRLQDAGQIEVTMTPFAHPILPLLVSTDFALRAMPGADLPQPPFVYGADAQDHVALGVELYEEHFGQAPRGMWPAEGSVAQEIVTMVSQNGIRWMASDEGVLARSLGMTSFTRDSSETVQEADVLYRPYVVQGRRGDPVAIVFRDVVISDKVGFTYSGVSGTAAVTDFVTRIHSIRESLIGSEAEGPHLVSVILDGENAWEHYENDGKEFLHSLYQQLSADPLIKTVTPSEFLEMAPEPPLIDELWAGSWINHDFSTWIGEDEENRAWDILRSVREFLQPYLVGAREAPSPEALEEAKTLMYIAEGSDWFWWYGSDQNSGNDESFDEQYRNTLKGVYRALEVEPPTILDVPIIPQQAVSADQPLTALISPAIDGVFDPAEWEGAGKYSAEGGVMATASPVFESISYGFDGGNFYAHIALQEPAVDLLQNGLVELYAGTPGAAAVSNFSSAGTILGFPANRRITISAEGGSAQAVLRQSSDTGWQNEGLPLESVAAGDQSIELSVPLKRLGNIDVGDRISMRLIYSGAIAAAGQSQYADTMLVPASGPAMITVPDLGNVTVVLDIEDPAGDDYGPGTYTYPQDGVFSAGNYDIVNFQVGFDEENIIFKFTMNGPVDNPWGSASGLSLQTFDVYIDQVDGGSPTMLPGRNLAIEEAFAWDYAVTVEGWTYGVYVPGDEGSPSQIAAGSELFVLADPGQQKVTVRVPKAILGNDPEAWRYAAVVLGQEGFPAGGVMRVRDVQTEAEQWRFGGAPAGSTNHTRVIDLVWPEEGQQETWLSDFTPSGTAQADLTAEDFAAVPMLSPQ